MNAVDPQLAKPTQAGMMAQPAPPGVQAAGPMSATQYAVHPGQRATPQDAVLQQHIPRPSGPVIADYPVMPGGQRPFSSDLAPSNLPQRSSYANAPFDPGAAASLMSPVGDQYPHADWERR